MFWKRFRKRFTLELPLSKLRPTSYSLQPVVIFFMIMIIIVVIKIIQY